MTSDGSQARHQPSHFTLLYIPALALAALIAGFVFALAAQAGTAPRLIAHASEGGAITTATPACTPSAGWSIVSSPNYPSAPNNYLHAVSALGPNDVWTVGYWYNSSPAKTLIEHWDGTQWSVISSPNPGLTRNELYGVFAVAPNDVWAVGHYFVVIGSDNVYQTLTLHWDGAAWTHIPSPNLGTWNNYLRGVTAVSANDVWAVGSYVPSLSSPEQTLMLHWDGAAWSAMPGPSPGSSYNILYSVDALASNDVWAVGYYNTANGADTLTLHWTGAQWNLVPSANGTGRFSRLSTVDAIAPNDVWAVGNNNPDPGGAGNVVLTLVTHWDGTQWTQIPSPSPATSSNYLNGVTAISANDVWAAGYQKSGTGPIQTLTQHWNGSAWSTIASPNTATSVNWLTGVDAVSANDVWAVGYSGNANTLTLRYLNTSCSTPTASATIQAAMGTATRTATIVAPTSTAALTSIVATGTATSISPSLTPTVSATLPVATSTAIMPTPTTPATATSGSTATVISNYTSTPTSTPTSTAIPTPTTCNITFTDVQIDHTFYAFIRCLVCRGIISGYSDGTFRPGNEITRGQIAKMVSNSAGFSENPGPQIYEDVPPASPFYTWINRLSMRGHMGGYPCGLVPEEACIPPNNRPYFRPNATATRGQLAKIVANAAGIGGEPSGQFYADVGEDHPFYVWIMRLTQLGVMSGYPCGTIPEEPCDDASRPYFRPFANVTRGQASKIVANTFYPNCETPLRQ
ncbi:MAG TPA: S-layer homology domain-containing protein [Chloroflexia bacterium]|nr:S-layer homology domain-containing protein [Chloroflexia bacterium]